MSPKLTQPSKFKEGTIIKIIIAPMEGTNEHGRMAPDWLAPGRQGCSWWGNHCDLCRLNLESIRRTEIVSRVCGGLDTGQAAKHRLVCVGGFRGCCSGVPLRTTNVVSRCVLGLGGRSALKAQPL